MLCFCTGSQHAAVDTLFLHLGLEPSHAETEAVPLCSGRGYIAVQPVCGALGCPLSAVDRQLRCEHWVALLVVGQASLLRKRWPKVGDQKRDANHTFEVRGSTTITTAENLLGVSGEQVQ